jgi:hypothetical protein
MMESEMRDEEDEKMRLETKLRRSHEDRNKYAINEGR